MLSDGKISGDWLLVLAIPYHGRAIQGIKALFGERTLIFDRESSYLGFLLKIDAEQIKYVIRLNQGSKPPKFYYDAEQKRELKLRIAPGEGTKIYR